MTSPSESYAENRAEERSKARREGAAQRRRILHDMMTQVGFGAGQTWEELEVKRHLDAAFALLGLIK